MDASMTFGTREDGDGPGIQCALAAFATSWMLSNMLDRRRDLGPGIQCPHAVSARLAPPKNSCPPNKSRMLIANRRATLAWRRILPALIILKRARRAVSRPHCWERRAGQAREHSAALGRQGWPRGLRGAADAARGRLGPQESCVGLQQGRPEPPALCRSHGLRRELRCHSASSARSGLAVGPPPPQPCCVGCPPRPSGTLLPAILTCSALREKGERFCAALRQG